MPLDVQAKKQGELKPSDLLHYIQMHIDIYGDNSTCFMLDSGEAERIHFSHTEGKDGALFIFVNQ